MEPTITLLNYSLTDPHAMDQFQKENGYLLSDTLKIFVCFDATADLYRQLLDELVDVDVDLSKPYQFKRVSSTEHYSDCNKDIKKYNRIEQDKDSLKFYYYPKSEC